jgi:hypothetical protein
MTPYTDADIDKLRRAIALGATRVEFGSGDTKRVVEYRSLAEMQRILADMTAEVQNTSISRTSYIQRSRD